MGFGGGKCAVKAQRCLHQRFKMTSFGRAKNRPGVVPTLNTTRTEANIQRPSFRRHLVSQEDQERNQAFILQRLNYILKTWLRKFVVTL